MTKLLKMLMMRLKVSSYDMELHSMTYYFVCTATGDNYAVLNHPVTVSIPMPDVHDVDYAAPSGYINSEVSVGMCVEPQHMALQVP